MEMESYIPLAKQLARKMAFRCRGTVRYDDLLSLALEGLWRASQSWKPERGASFGTYAGRKITWSMQQLLRTRSRERKERARCSASLHPGIADNRCDDPVERLATVDLAARALRVLPPMLREPVRLYFLDGYTMPQIARMSGFTKSNCSVLIKQGLKEMRENLTNPRYGHGCPI